ncbi:hypothetical protein BC834DRAFT_892434 [Gloeopeniophorella convolvens]|nr:hypothetical protein BC834DRAFT_892434 [Gloeopeniophorella convolvens]
MWGVRRAVRRGFWRGELLHRARARDRHGQPVLRGGGADVRLPALARGVRAVLPSRRRRRRRVRVRARIRARQRGVRLGAPHGLRQGRRRRRGGGRLWRARLALLALAPARKAEDVPDRAVLLLLMLVLVMLRLMWVLGRVHRRGALELLDAVLARAPRRAARRALCSAPDEVVLGLELLEDGRVVLLCSRRVVRDERRPPLEVERLAHQIVVPVLDRIQLGLLCAHERLARRGGAAALTIHMCARAPAGPRTRTRTRTDALPPHHALGVPKALSLRQRVRVRCSPVAHACASP